MSSETPISKEEGQENSSQDSQFTNIDDHMKSATSGSQNAKDDSNTNNISSIKEEEDLGSVKSNATQVSDTEGRLEQLENEHETLKNQYMRIAADFDNFRKRQTRDNDDLRIQLTCNTLSEILPVVDNFERARQQLTPEGEEAKSLHRNYQGLYKQLVEVLKKLGVAPMRVVGQQFDPNLHEAVLREPSDLHKEDLITEELQRGYHLDGRVIRHALVKVSMGPGPTDEGSSNSEETHNLTDNATGGETPSSN